MLFSFLTLCSLTKLKIKYFFLKLGYKDLSDKNAITIPVIFLQNVKNVKNKAYQKVTFLALEAGQKVSKIEESTIKF